MKEEMMTTGFTGGDTATGPTAGYDPVLKMRAKRKDLKGLVAPGNKVADPTVVKKKVKSEDYQYEAKVDKKIPDYKRATARDKRYGNPHGSHELGGGIRKDRRADHENRRGVKEEEIPRGPGGKPIRIKDKIRAAKGQITHSEGKTFDAWKKAAASALGRKKEERKAQPATDAGARARRKLKDKEQKKYVNFLPAEDD